MTSLQVFVNNRSLHGKTVLRVGNDRSFLNLNHHIVKYEKDEEKRTPISQIQSICLQIQRVGLTTTSGGY